MAEKDVESVLSDIDTFLKYNLNTAITNLNNEKNDGITNLTVDSNAFIFQSLNNAIANYNPFVFYGISNVSNDSIYGATAKIYTIQVIIVVINDPSDNEMGKRILRYNRVFSDLFESNFDSISAPDEFKIKNLEPISFQLINSDNLYLATGVELEVALY